MTDVESILVDGRQAVREALSAVKTDLVCTVRGSYPRSTDDGVIITVGGVHQRGHRLSGGG